MVRDVSATDLHRPKRCTTRELAKAGVELVNDHRMMLACEGCGQHWSPDLQPGGRRPRGYWRCPNGCNSHAE